MAIDLNQVPLSESGANGLCAEGVWQSAPDPLEAVRGADAVLLLTEWAEFRTLDWPQLSAVMRPPAWLFDARTVADAASARSAGLRVWVVGVGEA